ncbi:MAG: hypothetical protein MRJ65_01885 [Candidatus Brocadiaceae bacterium]|nr:hypothetical protein [Candidatus Brocadiaceae bacterium]
MSDVIQYEEVEGDTGSELALEEQTAQETGDVTVEVVECNPESEVVCDEASEPLPLSYGDHTSGCEINPASNPDTYEFVGSAGDVVRICIVGQTNNLDPHLEVFDPPPSNTKIVDTLCNAGTFNICSFSEDIVLPLSGTYLLAMTDSGVDNAGNYQVSVTCLVGDCCGDVTIRRYKKIVSLPDINNNNLPETAALVTTNGIVQVLIQDAGNQNASGMWFFSDNFRPVSMASVPDMNLNNSLELAVLVVNKASGHAFVKIRDALTKEVLNFLWVVNTAIWKPVSLTSIPDMNNNNIPELVVLAVNNETKAVQGFVRDALTKEDLGTINYPPSVGLSP